MKRLIVISMSSIAVILCSSCVGVASNVVTEKEAEICIVKELRSFASIERLNKYCFESDFMTIEEVELIRETQSDRNEVKAKEEPIAEFWRVKGKNYFPPPNFRNIYLYNKEKKGKNLFKNQPGTLYSFQHLKLDWFGSGSGGKGIKQA